jgi:membrane protease YdiL (CAAX protease family)
VSGFVKLFVNSERKLRNGWWIAIFLLSLAVVLVPAIILSSRVRHQLTLADQALMIAAVTILCQLLRRRPVVEVTGQPDIRWLSQLGAGMAAGALLMAVPALVLTSIGAIRWQFGMFAVAPLLTGVETMAAGAIAEELLFRGFLFQRLVDGLGAWPAQLVVAGMFLLTHLNNPGMTGVTRFWAGINIFLASILFGLAFLKTRSLAMPIGLHFMANLTQGPILGFGVSGNAEAGLLKPSFSGTPQWLTGGAFGLEASLPGLICVAIGLVLLLRTNGLSLPAPTET